MSQYLHKKRPAHTDMVATLGNEDTLYARERLAGRIKRYRQGFEESPKCLMEYMMLLYLYFNAVDISSSLYI